MGRKAEGIFIPKEDGATSVGKFRTISLLNVEGKLYFALWSDRLVTYTLSNKYIDTSIQKGGVRGSRTNSQNTSACQKPWQKRPRMRPRLNLPTRTRKMICKKKFKNFTKHTTHVLLFSSQQNLPRAPL